MPASDLDDELVECSSCSAPSCTACEVGLGHGADGVAHLCASCSVFALETVHAEALVSGPPRLH